MDMNTSKNTDSLSPKVACAVFFAIYSLFFLLFAKYTFLSMNDGKLIPLLPSILILLVLSVLIGAVFGRLLAKQRHWLPLFLWGCLVALIGILFVGLVTLFYHHFYDTTFVSRIHSWKDYFIIYGLVVASITLVIGLWLIPLTGFATIYFNKRFLPGFINAASKANSLSKKPHE